MKSNNHFMTALAATLLIGTARVGFAVVCGETITTKETLTADLNCMTNPGLTIGAGGSLDLNGFKVTCNGTARGIVLAADDTSVSNGSVGDCSEYGILLQGSGHNLTGMYVFDSNSGIYSGDSLATGIKIKDSAVAGAVVGINLAGGENSISGVSVSVTSSGVYLGKDGNKVKDVTIINASFRGLALHGAGNKASNVRIADSTTGFYSGAANNKYSNVHSANHSFEGVTLGGNGNKLLGCTAISDTNAYGIALHAAMANKVSNCTTLAGFRGISSQTNDSEISKNRVFGSTAYGILASSSNSAIKKNVGLGSGTFDFEDTTVGCNNIWSDNTGKKGQSCVQ